MFFTRWNHSTLQLRRAAGRRFRRAGGLGAAFLAAGLVLTGCEFFTDEARDQQTETRIAMVTSAFEATGRARSIALVPSGETPWRGLVVASLASGGFDVFTIDGEQIITASGPSLRGLAAAADFPLRGAQIPLLFGVDDNGALRGFALIREINDIVELPLEEDAPQSGAAGVCLYRYGIGYVELAVLAEGNSATILRVRDVGRDGLQLTRQGRIPLPFPARGCAAADLDLVISGPTAGLARVTPEGRVQARADELSVSSAAYSTLLGRPAVLTASAQTGRLAVYDARTLELIMQLRTEDGLNAPAFLEPAALSISEDNFGGMAFSTGVFAVYDAGDGRVKLMAREVLSRTVVTPD